MRDFNDVYEVVQLIPSGRVSSYGAIAKYLGTSPRVVGWAMNAAHAIIGIPAHRVVNRHGILTGKMHFETPTRMQELLEREGIIVKENQIVNFQDFYWNPENELA